jgi:hypothetical protein
LGISAYPVGAVQTSESICAFTPDEQLDPPAEPAELCGVTTVKASTSSVIRVTLTRKVDVTKPFTNPLGPDGTFKVEGEGPFVGLVLTEDIPARDGRLVIAGSVLSGPSRDGVFGTMGGPRHLDWDGSLPPGQYRLYVLASGSPVTVTLKFPELEGSVELTPTTPNRFDVRALEPRIWEADRKVYSAGEDGQLHTNGLLFQSFWYTSPDYVVGDGGTCYYDEPSPEPYAYMPGCPTAGGFRSGPYLDTEPVSSSGWGGGGGLVRGYPPGTYGQGAWYVTADEVTDAGSVMFWLDLD